MRFLTRQAVLALAVGSTCALLAPSAVSAAPGEPLGGEHMASKGIVVDTSPGVPALPAVSAASFVVADVDSGAVYAAKDPHGPYAPASTLKTLTAATLVPLLDPDATVVATRAAADADGTRVGVVAGTSYRVGDLLTAMLIMSGNDAAVALADANGGLETTLVQMNAEAARLQALDTVAKTPNGLDAAGQVSSAYDLALINRYALSLPAFRDYVATKRAPFPKPDGTTFEIATHNKLLLNYDGAIGIKNGYTTSARASFVGAATRGGRTLIVTLLRADPTVWKEAATLLDWGFAAAASARPVGTLVDPVPPPSKPTPSSEATLVAQQTAAAHIEATSTKPRAHGSSGSVLAPVVSVLFILGAGVLALRVRVVRRQRARRHRRYLSSLTRF